MPRLRQHGLDMRFLLFVSATMVGSLLVGSVARGLTASFSTGDPGMLFVVPFLAMVGAGFVIPLAFIAWIVPSALIFSVCMIFLAEPLGAIKAAQWSGTVTALVAALATTYVATDFGRNFDGFGSLMLFVGPAAVVIAPWVAFMAYRPDVR